MILSATFDPPTQLRRRQLDAVVLEQGAIDAYWLPHKAR
jgi:hypothetical protein